MIAIIDYGMGNLRSVSKAFEAVGHQAVVTRDPHVIPEHRYDCNHRLWHGQSAQCLQGL
jgi:imidazoleglycerol phosphate synthase glutamine amidotransferase subunit HisH